ncbi:Ig-like domain-containing protein [Costertonia aggregata]|uniref:Ig-like domain-containing protein n=1 Tax=Costertonia aggregata TaxID=343403 RepID=A0A7H9ANY6_9FLAO|nr:Ig-like domain-containing protein [Costertonia aggregata]QLG45169.1 Ig-like domain-containing protein [Costertonia aggregata]
MIATKRLTFLIILIIISYCAEATAQKSAPVAVADTYNTAINYTLNVNAVNGLLANDTDSNGTAGLTVGTTPVSGPSSGSLTLNTDGSFIYIPNSGFVGTDTFEYRVCDDGTPNPIVSQFDFDTATLTNATVGPNATSINANAVQTACGIRIGTGAGGSTGLDFVVPNTGGIFDFTSFRLNIEYRDQESTADIITGGNIRLYHISGNSLGIRINVIDGITGVSTAYTQTLGNFLSGNVPYSVEYDEVSGNIIYDANGTVTTFSVAPPNSPLDTALSSNLTLGRFMDNSGSANPSLCLVAITDTSKLCDTGTVDLDILATIITNRRITYRVRPN